MLRSAGIAWGPLSALTVSPSPESFWRAAAPRPVAVVAVGLGQVPRCSVAWADTPGNRPPPPGVLRPPPRGRPGRGADAHRLWALRGAGGRPPLRGPTQQARPLALEVRGDQALGDGELVGVLGEAPSDSGRAVAAAVLGGEGVGEQSCPEAGDPRQLLALGPAALVAGRVAILVALRPASAVGGFCCGSRPIQRALPLAAGSTGEPASHDEGGHPIARSARHPN